MIWNTETERRAPEQVLARELACDVMRSCGPVSFDGERLEELTHGVAAFCFRHLGGPAFDGDSITAFLGRALWCAGERHAAVRWLDARAELSSLRNTALELCRHEGTSAVLFHAAACGLLKHTRWTSAGDESVWILDFDKLNQADGALELFFHVTLRSLLHHVSAVWDEGGGSGILALRGCQGMAGRVIRGRRSAGKIRSRVAEFRLYCEEILQKAGHQAGWTETPRVILLGP